VASVLPDVIAAALRQARDHDMPALIEAPADEVNRFGGSSGLTPDGFAALVRGIAASQNLDRVPLILGAAGLGPLPTAGLGREAALLRAEREVMDFAAAGFTRLQFHGPDAESVARLVAAAEASAPAPAALCHALPADFVPDGDVTTPETLARALDLHEAAFAGAGLGPAVWRRVRTVVVRLGLGYGPTYVERFDMEQPDLLSAVLQDRDRIALEVRGADYQTASACADLTRRNVAVLGLGPALSFAWREALYALSHVHGWTSGSAHVSERMEALMLADPAAWGADDPATAHLATDAQQRMLRHFGFLDRIRHYWPRARPELEAMADDLQASGMPYPLLLQYLPPETLGRAARLDLPPAQAILQAQVEQALAPCYPEEIC
jgi:D-tagatose-1,6-bisphosphate aldolase subunit GatZ/KbaZ